TADVLAIDKHLVYRWSTSPELESGVRVSSLRLSLPPAVPAPLPAAAPAEASAPNRIRVGGNVQQAMLLEQPRPLYPPLAKQARMQGVVRVEAILARDGTVSNLTVMSGHPLLVESAIEAVKRWVYKQTLLNGEPVEVVTVIDVNFTLSQ